MMYHGVSLVAKFFSKALLLAICSILAILLVAINFTDSIGAIGSVDSVVLAHLCGEGRNKLTATRGLWRGSSKCEYQTEERQVLSRTSRQIKKMTRLEFCQRLADGEHS